MKASIIVPVYKSKDLRRCIESILQQTYKNIEVILVDDSSPDGGGKICDQYASLDKRIHVIHQINSGTSAARNRGIKFSHGDVLYFVDDDDYISCTLIEDTLNRIIKDNSDIVMFGVCELSAKTKKKRKKIADNFFGADYSNLEKSDIRILGLLGSHSTVWDKAYRRTLWKGISFPEGRTGEDLSVSLKLWKSAKSISVLPEVYYYYNRLPHGSILQLGGSRTLYGYFLAWKEAFMQVQNDTELFDYKEFYKYNYMKLGIMTIHSYIEDHYLAECEYQHLISFLSIDFLKDIGKRELIFFAHFYTLKYLEEQQKLAGHILPRFSRRFIEESIKVYNMNKVLNILDMEKSEQIIKNIRKSSKIKLKWNRELMRWCICRNFKFVEIISGYSLIYSKKL